MLAHRLSLVATYAGALEYRPDATPEKRAEAAGVIRSGIQEALDELREVVRTTFDTDDHVVRALRAGASGFLLKDTPPAKIVAAIHAVASGEPVMSPQVMRRLMDRVAVETGQHQKAQDRLRALSDRETEVVRAVASGQSNAEIAAALFMSVATVKAHISSILSKLDLDNRTQIALLAHDAGLA